MMVKWTNDDTLQANDGELLVNDGEMSVWSYIHFTIIDKHFTIINMQFTSILQSLVWSKPSFAHLTIIEKLHQLYWSSMVF